MIKRLANLLALLSVLPHLLRHRLAAAVLGRDRAFAGTAQHASRWAGLWGAYRRRALLRALAGGIAKDCHIELGTLLSCPRVVIGPGAYIGARCSLGDVHIGPKTMLADGVCIPSGPHKHGIDRLDIPMADQPGQPRVVSVGQDCWIGAHAVVLADVGDHAIVAAGAVVTRAVEPFAIVAGVPARVVGRRTGQPGLAPQPAAAPTDDPPAPA